MRRTTRIAAGVATALAATTLAHAQATQAAEPAATVAPPDAEFQKVTLNDHPGEPIDLAVLPDSSVLHTTRSGEIWRNDPLTGLNTLAGEIDVYEHDEEGLQSIAIDPDFGVGGNNWVYLYYSPPLDTPADDPATAGINEGDAPLTGTAADFAPYQGHITLSRFAYADGQLDLATEQQIMDVPVDRGICCHVGGDIVFDAEGDLYLSTGDDSNPFSSDGFAPLDERPDVNPAFDAQRSAANTNDLRGKILRVTVSDGGGYTIPDGNLFAPGTDRTRPEIYAMGLRNPFRIELDRATGEVLLADYSPDAGAPDPERGPAGTGKWTAISQPANYGWPYCATAELPYVDYDFATSTSGATFDCAAPVNTSPRNTGLTELPPVAQPDVWYSYDESAEFPELGTGGIGPMGGPVYSYDESATRGRTPVAWPEHYAGTPLLYEWTRDWVKAIHRDDAGAVSSIEDVVSSIVTDNPMDMEFGPDGALYVLEYGDGYFAENEDAQLSRIDYIGPGGNRSPVPVVTADPLLGDAPLTVTFSSAGTADPDGDRLRYAWDFDADGVVDSRRANPTFTYAADGVYDAHLRVTDVGSGLQTGRAASTYVTVTVGNVPPTLEFVSPTADTPFSFGDTVAYEVVVTDDEPVDCDQVTVTYVLGHDQHGHPQSTASGCTGSLVTTVPGGHDPGTDNLSAVFSASYTDAEGETGYAEVVLGATPP